MTKAIILNMLKAYFIGVTRLLINIEDMTMIVECGEVVRQEPAKGLEYFSQVCEAYNFKDMTKIFIDFKRKDILLQGTDIAGKPKEVLL